MIREFLKNKINYIFLTYCFLLRSWGILFSHPADYTPVCTTELSRVAQLVPDFVSRNVKPIALSCDSVDSHLGWIADIIAYGSKFLDTFQFIASFNKNFQIFLGLKTETPFPYPIIDDEKRELAVKLEMLDKNEIGSAGLPLTCRAVFIVDSKKKLRAKILYPATTGRNFE